MHLPQECPRTGDLTAGNAESWWPAEGPGDHTCILRLGIQMASDNMGYSWSKEFGNQCCSLKPCLFWAENRHASVCRASQMNCNFVHQFIGRGNPFFLLLFLPSHLFFLLPRSFYTHSKPMIKWFQCVVTLREGRDPDEAQRVGNRWLSPFLFPVTQLQAVSTRQISYFQFTAIF